MTITELKRITSALSTFATVREKATGPESLIGVQSKGGVLKLIAGNAKGGIIVSAGIGDSEDGAFAVPARPFLSAVKTLKGKLDIGIAIRDGRLEITTDKGGRLQIADTDTLREAGFAKKPKRFTGVAYVTEPRFKQIARLFGAVTQGLEIQPPTLEFHDDVCILSAFMPTEAKALHANIMLDAKSEGEPYGTAYADFWNALSVLDAEGIIQFGDEGVLATSGLYEVFSAPYLVSVYDPKLRKSHAPEHPKPWPVLGFSGEYRTSFTIDRKVFIEAIRGQASADEYNRVTFTVSDTGLEVSPFGAEDGLLLPVNTFGVGVRSMNAAYLLDLLRAMDASKEVTLGWGNSPAVRLNGDEYDGWTILAAPVALDAR